MDYEADWFGLLKVIMIAVAVILFLWICSSQCNNCVPPPDCDSVSIQIHSLDLENSLYGSFILGTGSINGNMYYYFYKDDGDGIILDKANAEYTRIIEGNDVKPSFVKFRQYMCNGTYARDTLYVPVDTVKKQFDVRT